MAHSELLTSFHRELYTEFVAESGLVVMAKGLGLLDMVKALVDLYATPEMLVFLLGATSTQEAMLLSMFTAGEEQLVDHVNFKIIKNDTSAKRRLEVYLHGGVISITSRIMLIDLLKERIPAHMITCVMLLDAHRVSEFALEAFILDLYRARNHVGLVKAFTDCPEALTGGISKVEKTCKFLKAPKLFLYPRFHATVKEDLDKVNLEVDELYVGMTSKMRLIQISLMEVMESLVNELVRSNPSLDVKECNTETAITGAFDQQIRRQLDPIWHRVSLKSKQLLNELRVLRILLIYLVQYDAISFCRFVETIVMADAASAIGTVGFKAYWLMMDAAQTAIRTARDRVYRVLPQNGTLQPTVERAPKWRALERVLREAAGKRIVIMVKEEHTRRQLLRMIVLGYEAWERTKYEEFLAWRKRARKQGGLSTGLAARNETASSTLWRRKSRLAGVASGPAEVMERVGWDEESQEGSSQIDESMASWEDTVNVEGLSLPKGISIHCYGEDGEDYLSLLYRTSPDRVVMYDSDLAYIRSLEVHSFKCAADSRLGVTMLVYQQSVEEQLQLLHIRQEKEAFEALIKAKADMAPLAMEGPTVADKEVVEEMHTMDRFSGLVEELGSRRIIVDMRELRSSLPFVLYKHNFRLEPLTILVGDYILSPTLCVERKSTSDLISSLNSGRLYSQVEQMSRHYETPILLIEFDEGRPFTLLPSGDVRSDISISDVASKLCLLLLHFPMLRIIWSASLAATAETFLDLKRDQPDPVLPEEGEASEGGDPTARDVLLALPGVNEQNCHAIMRHVRSIRELCQRTKSDLADLIGATNANQLFTFLHESI